MKPLFDVLDDWYNESAYGFRKFFKANVDGNFFVFRPTLYHETILDSFSHHFPFLTDIPVKINHDMTVWEDHHLRVNIEGGISSPFESILHELGHCLYFLKRGKLERIKLPEFGLSTKITHTVEVPAKLKLDAYKNELMAGAYQLKMMTMVSLSPQTIASWLDSFCDSFSSTAGVVDSFKNHCPIDVFKDELFAACNAITTESLIEELKVLCNCLKTGILTPTKETP